MKNHYEAPEMAALGDAGQITLGGEVWPIPDAITFFRGWRR